MLVGAGHAHAQVLLAWARCPLPNVEVIVVSPQAFAPYSGMVPGWLAGHYRFEQIVIDFPALCAKAGALWIESELDVLDPLRGVAALTNGQLLEFDVLSLNVGSTLRPPPAMHAETLALRPLSKLPLKYGAVLDRWVTDRSAAVFAVSAVGGGAAGFESLMAVVARLRELRPNRAVAGRLITLDGTLLPGYPLLAQRAAARALAAADIAVQRGLAWPDIDQTSDLVLWATGAEAHDWQLSAARSGGIAVSHKGFICVDPFLRSVSHPRIFGAGDCAHWASETGGLPKAGVYAVRMGPILLHNLRAALAGGDFRPYRPQRQALALLATGRRHAIASRGSFGTSGLWVWRWKDFVDRRFVRRFQFSNRSTAE